jgi:hypothetical protein
MLTHNRAFRRGSIPLAALVVLAAAAAPTSAQTLVSGFNGDLSSMFGVNWTLTASAGTAAFVDALTEGTQAVQISNDAVAGSWPAMALAGGMPLAKIVATHRTLVLDAAPTADLAWRQVFVAQNSDGVWSQSDQPFNLQLPVEGDRSDRFAFDITAGATSWRSIAQSWLASPPASQTYFELLLILQGASGSGEAPLTTLDNVRYLAADFVNDQDGDLKLEGRVTGVDLGAWLTAYGTTAAGDADADGDSDGQDFLVWQRELDEPVPVIVTAAVPEPTIAALAAVAVLAGARQAIRRRFSAVK